MRSGCGYIQTTLRPRLEVDLGQTLWPMRRGTGDPTMRAERAGVWWRATRTPEGPATARYAAHAGEVQVVAWGPGAGWCLDHAAELLGGGDELEGFAPDGLVGRLHRAMPGLRISRSRAVFEALVPTILEQKVAGAEARASYRGMVRAWGTPAPGPAVPAPGGPRQLLLPPAAEELAARSYWEFHRFGIEMRRANVIRGAAARAVRVDRVVEMPLADAHSVLQALPGIGPWTSAEVALVALGDADAVPVGDYHLPHLVSWAFAGEPRGSDERMLELLEPYAGQRGRVLRLLARSGNWAPRLGPRMPLRSFKRF
jgi:3-methyladenine DNA glycosylase/8-oxoguanine DNA glycosylase